MIGIHIQGRLGNQMFQYAFIISAGLKLNTHCFLSFYHHPLDLPKYFDMPHFNPLRNKIINLMHKKRLIKLEKASEQRELLPKGNLELLTDKKIYYGFYQSLEYFQSNIDLIKSAFQVKSHYRQLFHERLQESGLAKEKIVCIHVRRDDYPEHMMLLNDYYKKAIECLGDIQNYRILLVGFRSNEYLKDFDYIPNLELFSDSIMNDFQMIMEADIAIISNSSFAWWAAFLGEKKERKIIAPKYWFGFHEKIENPLGISSSLNWNWL